MENYATVTASALIPPTHETHEPLEPRPPDAERGHWLIQRWPTLVAAGLALISWGIPPMRAMHFLPILPLLYVVVTGMGRRALTWPAAFVATGAFLILESLGVDTFTAIAAAAVAFAGVGAVAGRVRDVAIQSAAFIAFFGLSLVAMSLEFTAGTLLIAAGWAGHGLWDLWHLLRDRAVSRTFAEWCAVVDLLAAAGLVVMALR